MDFSDFLHTGDVIAIAFSLVGFFASIIRAQAKAVAFQEKFTEYKDFTSRWLSENRVRMHDMANQITATNLKTAISSEKTDKIESDVQAIKDRQENFDSKIFDKLSKLEKDLARLEGKLGLVDNR